MNKNNFDSLFQRAKAGESLDSIFQEIKQSININNKDENENKKEIKKPRNRVHFWHMVNDAKSLDEVKEIFATLGATEAYSFIAKSKNEHPSNISINNAYLSEFNDDYDRLNHSANIRLNKKNKEWYFECMLEALTKDVGFVFHKDSINFDESSIKKFLNNIPKEKTAELKHNLLKFYDKMFGDVLLVDIEPFDKFVESLSEDGKELEQEFLISLYKQSLNGNGLFLHYMKDLIPGNEPYYDNSSNKRAELAMMWRMQKADNATKFVTIENHVRDDRTTIPFTRYCNNLQSYFKYFDKLDNDTQNEVVEAFKTAFMRIQFDINSFKKLYLVCPDKIKVQFYESIKTHPDHTYFSNWTRENSGQILNFLKENSPATDRELHQKNLDKYYMSLLKNNLTEYINENNTSNFNMLQVIWSGIVNFVSKFIDYVKVNSRQHKLDTANKMVAEIDNNISTDEPNKLSQLDESEKAACGVGRLGGILNAYSQTCGYAKNIIEEIHESDDEEMKAGLSPLK